MRKEVKDLLALFHSDMAIRSERDLNRHYCLTGHEWLAMRNRFTFYGMACAIGFIFFAGLAGLVVALVFGG